MRVSLSGGLELPKLTCRLRYVSCFSIGIALIKHKGVLIDSSLVSLPKYSHHAIRTIYSSHLIQSHPRVFLSYLEYTSTPKVKVQNSTSSHDNTQTRFDSDSGSEHKEHYNLNSDPFGQRPESRSAYRFRSVQDRGFYQRHASSTTSTTAMYYVMRYLPIDVE